MPKLIKTLPKYRKHKATGQAVVTLDDRDIYLGPWKTKASLAEYDRLIAEWLARGRAAQNDGSELTVNELLARYWKHATGYYRKGGKVTPEVNNIRVAVRPLKRLYGRTRVGDFTPLALKAIQEDMIASGLSRPGINARVNRIRRVFRWGVAECLIPSEILHGLAAVRGLKRGRTEAKERPPVVSVPDTVLEATLPFLPPIVADLATFQRLTGCRPSEACNIRPMDVDRDEDVWKYRVQAHKTEHYGKDRIVHIGPLGQDVLRSYLLRPAAAYCFDPRETVKRLRAARNARRKTPLSCGNRIGTNRRKNPKRQPGQRYTRVSYASAVARACEAAKVDHWSPNQLRHTFATAVREDFGAEAAQHLLGHSRLSTTELYAEKSRSLASDVVSQIG
jgi:integrase